MNTGSYNTPSLLPPLNQISFSELRLFVAKSEKIVVKNALAVPFIDFDN
jgi:hypothetical protein